jgi:tetratricopeptide (TPR) repeat protein
MKRCHAAAAVFLLLALFSISGFASDTNLTRLGVFPFDNKSGDKKWDFWREAFSQKIENELSEATPRRLKVYINGVLKELTNNAWNGEQAISRELAGKVADKLGLRKMVLGNFKRSEQGWQVGVEILEPGAEGKVLEFEAVQTQDLLREMTEKVCEAFGVNPEPAYLELSTKFRISNEAIDRLKELSPAVERGGTNEALIEGLRKIVAIEPNYFSGRLALMGALFSAGRTDEVSVEAQKLIELGPRLCHGYLALAACVRGSENERQERSEELFLKALKVHPGCPNAARYLFPSWVSQDRWRELKAAAQKAHEARPNEPASTVALAAALARMGDSDGGWKLINDMDSIDDDPDPDLHGLLLVTAVSVPSIRVLAEEMLWLQQRRTNNYVAELMAEVDKTFWLNYGSNAPSAEPARQYSRAELRDELARRLTPPEVNLLENPLLASETTSNRARALTVGLTNATAKATVLFGYVIEERLKTEQQATNSSNPGQLPVCHQYASRLVSLARAIGLPAWLVHVDLTMDEVSGYHDRAAIQVGNGVVLHYDPTLATLGSPRDNFRMLDDVQAIAHHMLQGAELAKVRIAQKLDPDDPWTRLRVIVELARLERLEEAQKLWDGLEPGFTNRWDYYFSRVVIEEESSHSLAALDWNKRAEALSTNNAVVLLQMGRLYQRLNDRAKSAEYMERAIKLGGASYLVGRKSDLEYRIKFTRAEADGATRTEAELRSRVAKGELPAQLTLINILFRKGEMEEAMKLLREGADKGDAIFQENYARNAYLLNRSVATPEIVDYLRKAALQENSDAYYLLAKLLFEAKGIPKAESEASEWAHRGAWEGEKRCKDLVKEMGLFLDPVAFAEGKKKAEAFVSAKKTRPSILRD